jgi:hypothetical protein
LVVDNSQNRTAKRKTHSRLASGFRETLVLRGLLQLLTSPELCTAAVISRMLIAMLLMAMVPMKEFW